MVMNNVKIVVSSSAKFDSDKIVVNSGKVVVNSGKIVAISGKIVVSSW